jgi:hypothetical protein
VLKLKDQVQVQGKEVALATANWCRAVCWKNLKIKYAGKKLGAWLAICREQVFRI